MSIIISIFAVAFVLWGVLRLLLGSFSFSPFFDGSIAALALGTIFLDAQGDAMLGVTLGMAIGFTARLCSLWNLTDILNALYAGIGVIAAVLASGLFLIEIYNTTGLTAWFKLSYSFFIVSLAAVVPVSLLKIHFQSITSHVNKMKAVGLGWFGIIEIVQILTGSEAMRISSQYPWKFMFFIIVFSVITGIGIYLAPEICMKIAGAGLSILALFAPNTDLLTFGFILSFYYFAYFFLSFFRAFRKKEKANAKQYGR